MSASSNGRKRVLGMKSLIHNTYAAIVKEISHIALFKFE